MAQITPGEPPSYSKDAVHLETKTPDLYLAAVTVEPFSPGPKDVRKAQQYSQSVYHHIDLPG